MAVKASIQITRDGDLPDVGSQWLRRNFNLVFEQTLSLTTAKTELKHHLSTIQFVYVEKTAGTGSVYLYKNMSPESWEFDGFFVAMETSVENLAFNAESTATIRVFLAGS